MRKEHLLKYFSLCFCVIILMNLFSGSVLTLLLSCDNEEISSQETEKDCIGDELELISIPVGVISSVNFCRLNDHEIIYNKKLYDVARRTVKDGWVNYYCVNDSREEKILDEIRQCAELHFNYFNTGKDSIPETFKIFTQENILSFHLGGNLPVLNFFFALRIDDLYYDIFLKKNYPPPEILVS